MSVWLLALQRLAAMAPPPFIPSELFPGLLLAPLLAAQYSSKVIILVAAGRVFVSTWTNTRIVVESTAMLTSLLKHVDSMQRPANPAISA